MPESTPTTIFRIFKDGVFVREEELHLAVIKIGKLSSSHLRLEDDSVSRMHAVVEASASGVTLIDLGSTVGTFVNGARVNKTTLRSGDVLEIGTLRIELVLRHAEGTAQTPASAAPNAALPPIPSAISKPVEAPPLPALAPLATMQPELPQEGVTAIEVTSTFGETVVGMKHVMNPRGGSVTNLTKGLFAGGAALLLLSGIAFFSGVGTAADNKSRLHEHLSAKKAAHEFRPRMLSSAFDWMALGGLAGGMVCLTAGLVRIREERIQPSYRIGSAPNVDLPISDAPSEDFPLVAPEGDRFVCNIAPEWSGHLAEGSQVTSFADLAAEGRATPSTTVPGAMQLAIPRGGRIRVDAGAQKFSIHPVTSPRKQAVPFFGRSSTEMAAYLAGTAIVVLGFVAMLDTLQPDESTLGGENFASTGRFTHTKMSPLEDPIEEPDESDGKDSSEGGTGTKAARDEGKMGDKNETRPTGQFAMKNRGVAPTLAKAAVLAQARTAGVLGYFAANDSSFRALTGSADFSSGLDDRDVYGGLTGSEVAAAAGGWGHGVSEFGPGGGGDGWGTIGTSKLGIIGHSDETGSGYKSGGGKGEMRRHKSEVPDVVFGTPSKDGDLDPSIIRRYVRRKLARIRHCYEKGLLVDGNLSGTVTTSFQIAPNGTVQSVRASGLGNTSVETCVADTLSTINFPAPADGGYVNVRSYPFTFQPAG